MVDLKITLPTKWSEVSLGQLIGISKLNSEDDLYNDKVISILTGQHEEVIKIISDEVKEDILSKLAWVEKSEIEVRDFNIIEINGQKFGRFQEEYTSVVEFVEGTGYDDKIENLDKIVVALLRPVIDEDEFGNYTCEEYDMKKCNSRRDFMMKYLDAQSAYSILSFFLSMWKSYTEDILTSLGYTSTKKENSNQTENQEVGSPRSGDGQTQSGQSPNVAYLETLTMLREELLSKLSIT